MRHDVLQLAAVSWSSTVVGASDPQLHMCSRFHSLCKLSLALLICFVGQHVVLYEVRLRADGKEETHA